MNRNYVLSILLGCTVAFLPEAGRSQSPGGVSTGLKIWFKANDAALTATSDGAVVSTWTDQSGNSYNATQATTANKPVYYSSTAGKLINFNPALSFNGAGQVLVNNAAMFSSAAPYSFMMVGVDESTDLGYRKIFGAEGSVDYFGVYKVSGAATNNGWTEYTLGNNYLKGTGFAATGGPSGYWNGTAYVADARLQRVQPQVMGINGANTVSATSPFSTTIDGYLSSGTLNSAGGIQAQFFQKLSIGGEPAAEYWKGRIPEFIAYNVQLNATQLQQVNSYLAIKYGVTLGQGGSSTAINNNAAGYNYIASDGSTILWNATGNSGYNYDIAGIARDDNSGLYQKQSQSVNNGASVTLGIGTISTSNNGNINTLSADKSALLWGGNITGTGTLVSNTSYIAGIDGFNAVLSKRWKVQLTGTGFTGKTIRVAISSANGIISPSGRLIVSTTGTFNNSGETTYPLAVSGGYLYADVPVTVLANGTYFTFGSLIQAPGGVSDSLALWVKSDNATAGAAWPDNSLRNNPVEVVGSPSLSAADAGHNYYPYYTNFSASNYFNDQNASMDTSDNSYGNWTRTSYSVFSAVRPTSAGTGRIVGIDNDNLFGAEPGFSLSAGKPYFYKFFETTGSNTFTTATTVNKSSVIYYNASQALNAGNGAMRIGLDGFEQTFNWAAGNFFHNLGIKLMIGYGTWDISSAFPGDIMEIAWYKRALTANEQGRVNSYLALKNGVTLGNTATPFSYLNSVSATVWTGSGTYQNNVAGIARDDNSGLNQKQSQSVNANVNNEVAIGLGAIAASNASNTGSFTKDQSFLVWGDNGTTTTLQADIAGSAPTFTYNGYSTNPRMNRVWTVTATNFLQPVQVSIPAASIGTVAVTSCQKLSLVVASDPSFTTNVSATVLTTSGSNYTAPVKFPAGTAYFTFARVEQLPPGIVYLPYATTPSIAVDPCLNNGWQYYYSDAGKTQKIFALNGNGNTIPAYGTGANQISGQVNYQAAPYEITDGLNTTHIMGRTLTITDNSSGTYVLNGGMKVRFYLDSAELVTSEVDNMLSQRWFKHPTDVASTTADQTAVTINNSKWFFTVTSGTEDGVDYVEYSGVQSFSTFGFASNTGPAASPLPLSLLSFTGVKQDNSTVMLSWKTADERNLDYFELQSGTNGKDYSTIAEVKASGVHEYSHPAPLQGQQSFYRLKIINTDGSTDYSNAITFKNSGRTIQQTVQVFPNPAGKEHAVSIVLGGYDGAASARLYNSVGLSAGSASLANGSNTMAIQDLPAGVYYLVVTDAATGSSITNKLIVK